MSNPKESPMQIRRDEMNAGFWKAVHRIEEAVRGLAKPDGYTPNPASITLRLVGEIKGHVIDVPLLHAEAEPFIKETEEEA